MKPYPLSPPPLRLNYKIEERRGEEEEEEEKERRRPNVNNK